MKCVHNVHYSTVVGIWGLGGGYGICCIISLVFKNFHFQKGDQVIIGIKLKIRIISGVS